MKFSNYFKNSNFVNFLKVQLFLLLFLFPYMFFGQNKYIYNTATTSYGIANLTHFGKISIGRNASLSNAPLTIYKEDYAYMEIANGIGRLQIARATNSGDWAPTSTPGTSIFRNLDGSHNMIFFMSDDNNDGSSKIKINDMVNHNSFVVFNNGKVTIGTEHFDYENYNLYVKNGIKTEKIKVEIAANNGWADYVFNNNYNLMPLTDLEKFIKLNRHLPEVPSESEAIKNGIELKEMNILLLKKVEELTLYMIELDKKIEAQEAEIEELRK